MNFWKFSLTFLVLIISTSVNASFIGDSITAEVSQPQYLGFTFNSNFGTGLVGEGIDFNAEVAAYDHGLVWDFWLDVYDSGFKIGWTEQNRNGYANLTSTNSDMIRVSLSGLDWIGINSEITDVSFVNYNCSSIGSSCSKAGIGPDNTDIVFNEDSLYIDFQTLRHGEQYVFDITTTPVPVPTAAWLFGSGLIGLVGFSRRKKV